MAGKIIRSVGMHLRWSGMGMTYESVEIVTQKCRKYRNC